MNKLKLKKVLCASVATLSLMSNMVATAGAITPYAYADSTGARAGCTGINARASVSLSFPDGPASDSAYSGNGTATITISASTYGYSSAESSSAKAVVNGVTVASAFWS